MAYAIIAKFLNPFHSVAWQFRSTQADKTADVLNPSIDLGQAAFWLSHIKLKVKVLVGVASFEVEMADALAGTGNVNSVSQCSFASAVIGQRFMTGWGDRSQQYLSINVTFATSGTYDAEVFATPVV